MVDSIPPRSEVLGCPVRGRGTTLRSACATCGGEPTNRQECFGPRTPLFLEGAAGSHVVAVVSGCLREVRTTPDGRAQAVRLVKAGELAGTEALVGRPYDSTLESLTRVRVCVVPAPDVLAHFERYPEGWRALHRDACGALQAVRETVLRIGLQSAEDRIFALFEELGSDVPRGRWFQLPLNRIEIGELLSLAHATVSRTIGRLVERGLIQVRGRKIRLLDRRD